MNTLVEVSKSFCEELGVDSYFLIKNQESVEDTEHYYFSKGLLRIKGLNPKHTNTSNIHTPYDVSIYPDSVESVKVLPVDYGNGLIKSMLVIEMYPEPHKVTLDDMEDALKLRLAINNWRVSSLYEKAY